MPRSSCMDREMKIWMCDVLALFRRSCTDYQQHYFFFDASLDLPATPKHNYYGRKLFFPYLIGSSDLLLTPLFIWNSQFYLKTDAGIIWTITWLYLQPGLTPSLHTARRGDRVCLWHEPRGSRGFSLMLTLPGAFLATANPDLSLESLGIQHPVLLANRPHWTGPRPLCGWRCQSTPLFHVWLSRWKGGFPSLNPLYLSSLSVPQERQDPCAQLECPHRSVRTLLDTQPYRRWIQTTYSWTCTDTATKTNPSFQLFKSPETSTKKTSAGDSYYTKCKFGTG